MTKRKVTRHAELTFATLCADSAVTCNQSHEDERGWDFFIQSPPSRTPGIPLDLQPPGTKCFAQVKSHKGKSRNITLKLSTALELAGSEIPAFIVVFCYNTSGTLVETRYLHLWQTEISRILLAVRELDAKGVTELQRHRIAFAIHAMKAIKNVDLIPQTSADIRSVGPDYSSKKHHLYKCLGFEDSALSGIIEYPPGTTLEMLVDNQIGVIDRIEGARITAYSTRFGIPSGTSITPDGTGSISMRSHPKACTVRISSELAQKQVYIPSELYVPNIPNLPEDLQKIRVKNSFSDIVLGLHDGKAYYRLRTDQNELHTFDNLIAASDLLQIVCAGEFRLEIDIDDKPATSANVKIGAPQNIPSLTVLDNFINYLRPLRAAEIPSEFRCSLASLLGQVKLLAYCTELATGTSVTGKCQIAWAQEAYSGRANVLFYMFVEIPNFVIYLIVRRRAELSSADDGSASFELRETQYCRVRILPGSHQMHSSSIEAEIDACAKAATDYPVLRFGPYLGETKGDVTADEHQDSYLPQ
ncbi:hypothetical protein [Rhizomicrobium electricum]|uniref:hypothetical protein n=1 Tax=Rhizomicrobium electricum TaxID=480070 RepID=UPI00142487E6|nr:hypothetical protein [Rhizomicrobium electricum]NIJ47761.1 hypothetical protein [Rhizomicrobium electricum]